VMRPTFDVVHVVYLLSVLKSNEVDVLDKLSQPTQSNVSEMS
jgi:hypothetical protein